jgi:hypothetical protein
MLVPKKYAMVDGNGIPSYTIAPSDPKEWNEGVTKGGLIAVEIPYDTDDMALVTGQRYDAASKTWVPMPARPAGPHVWSAEQGGWVDPRTPEQIEREAWAAVRRRRDGLIHSVAWRYERHARELRLGLPPTDDLAVLDSYVQALADITDQPDPAAIVWPALEA